MSLLRRRMMMLEYMKEGGNVEIIERELTVVEKSGYSHVAFGGYKYKLRYFYVPIKIGYEIGA